MPPTTETFTPLNTPEPIGPYSHVVRSGDFITISGTAGINPDNGQLAGSDVSSQTRQILELFKVMLEAAGSDLNHVMHINVFLKEMKDFDEMNGVYAELLGTYRPARTVIGVNDLPKPGVLLTMNLMAVVRN